MSRKPSENWDEADINSSEILNDKLAKKIFVFNPHLSTARNSCGRPVRKEISEKYSRTLFEGINARKLK